MEPSRDSLHYLIHREDFSQTISRGSVFFLKQYSKTMGGCCSCLGGDREEDANGAAAETELAETARKHLCISRGMSGPAISVEDRVQISGRGLALASCSIETAASANPRPEI